jgi:hypothetical protein
MHDDDEGRQVRVRLRLPADLTPASLTDRVADRPHVVAVDWSEI